MQRRKAYTGQHQNLKMKKTAACLLAILLFMGCEKGADCAMEDAACKEGYILWGGPREADGLGWYFAAGEGLSDRYILQEVPDTFKKDHTAVSLCLDQTDELYHCFCATPMPVWRVTSIKKR